MPKMKTNKAAARRFKITGTGKIMRRQGGKRHKNVHKTERVKRKLSSWASIDPAMEKSARELFPYPQYLR